MKLPDKVNYEAIFFVIFMIALGGLSLFIGIVADGGIDFLGIEISAAHLFNTFVIISLTLIARKVLLAEQQWRSAFEAAVEERNKAFLEDVAASVPLSNMRFIDNEKDWYKKAMSMLEEPTGFVSSGRGPLNTIFASTTVLNVSESEQVSDSRKAYFETIARVCCSSAENAPQYKLLLSPGDNDSDTELELEARLDAFDRVISEKAGDSYFRSEWAGAQVQIRIADVSGIDFVIYGDSVLFNLRTQPDENRSERKGIYVNDANIAQTFQRWFQSIYGDANNSRYITPVQARSWKLAEEHVQKIGVKPDDPLDGVRQGSLDNEVTAEDVR